MESGQKRIRSRRSHHKSRLGCGNCKKRRVKCDEKKPICSNCTQHAIECDFASESNSKSSSIPSRGSRFRHSKYQSIPAHIPDMGESISHSIAIQCDLSATSCSATGGISFADLQLFHHFITSTYRTLADEATDSNRLLWQTHLPRWGVAFPSILHLILALSALQLTYLHPDLRDQYLMQADDHFTFGVRSVTSVLALLDSENCQRIYISAVLICFVYFGRGPREDEYLIFNSRGKSEWLILLHGVRSILSSKSDEIFCGVLAIQSDKGGSNSLTPLLQEELLQHQMRIREIHALVEKYIPDDAEKTIYFRAMDDLLNAFEDGYQKRSLGGHPTNLMPCVMGWTYRLPGKFIERLEERESVALIIMAYWTILLKYMREAWFMEGWDRHVLFGIRRCLPDEFHKWIEWPESVIRTL